MMDITVADSISSDPMEALGPVVKSAGRALQILEYFDIVKREACVTEVSRALKLPQSSTSVLLRSLVWMGYLQHDRYRRTYLPTRRVSLLGNWLDPKLVQQGQLLDFAEELALDIGLPVVMAAPNGLFAQYIYVSRLPEGSESEGRVRIGELRLIERTAVGRAMLSTCDRRQLAGTLRRINAERRDCEATTNVNDFIAKIEAERRRGFFRGAGAGKDQLGLALIVDRNNQLLVLGIEGDAAQIAEGEAVLSAKLRGVANRMRAVPTVQQVLPAATVAAAGAAP